MALGFEVLKVSENVGYFIVVKWFYTPQIISYLNSSFANDQCTMPSNMTLMYEENYQYTLIKSWQCFLFVSLDGVQEYYKLLISSEI